MTLVTITFSNAGSRSRTVRQATFALGRPTFHGTKNASRRIPPVSINVAIEAEKSACSRVCTPRAALIRRYIAVIIMAVTRILTCMQREMRKYSRAPTHAYIRARAFPVFLTRASAVAEIFTGDMRFFARPSAKEAGNRERSVLSHSFWHCALLGANIRITFEIHGFVMSTIR